MPAGDAAGEQLVEQGVAQAFSGGDDRPCALDGVVNGVQHGGDGPLLRQGREEDWEGNRIIACNSLDGGPT